MKNIEERNGMDVQGYKLDEIDRKGTNRLSSPQPLAYSARSELRSDDAMQYWVKSKLPAVRRNVGPPEDHSIEKEHQQTRHRLR